MRFRGFFFRGIIWRFLGTCDGQLIVRTTPSTGSAPNSTSLEFELALPNFSAKPGIVVDVETNVYCFVGETSLVVDVWTACDSIGSLCTV